MESTILDSLEELGKQLNDIKRSLSLSKNVLNLKEVCLFTGLSKSHIYKLTSGQKIPHYKQAKHLFFDREEIENWLKEYHIKTANEIGQETSCYVTLNKKGVYHD